MKNIKQQFSDLRNNTPKHVQWLLLAAAFIVVLILLTLLLSGRDKSEASAVTDDESTELKLIVTPDETIDFSGTPAGETKTDDYIITASGATKIINVRTTTTSDDLLIAERDQDCKTAEKSCLIINQNCTTQTVNIDPQNGCRLTVTFYAKSALKPTGVSMMVDYRGAHDPDIMKKSQKLMVVVGAQAPKAENKKDVVTPAPETAPAPQVADDVPPEQAENDAQPESVSVKDEIKQEIEAIAPTAPILEEKEPAPVKTAAPEKTAPATQLRAETCSDFAFPGYNASGRQIGWIRPERGAYYFHPYSDTNCDTPTGVYNPDNGIISDIKDTAKKIGTDAEHIGYAAVYDGALPQLSNPVTKKVNKARQSDTPEDSSGMVRMSDAGQSGGRITLRPAPAPEVVYSTSDKNVVASTQPYDRTFILRQYKPIPATIVSDVRADVALEKDNVHFPVQATVDRNVYSDNGRTIIIPTGTLLLGYVTGEIPGPYKSIGRMNIKWYQFVLPNGVEFNFSGDGNDPVSADSQGRIGVPGRGSTDYLEQFVMPMLTAIVPAAVNMIAPIADRFVNQIDLDNNTVVQSGTVRSSELAKNEIITAWNQVAQKLMVDMMDNTTPPFTIPAGTRITVYSPNDLAVVCQGDDKPCSMKKLEQESPTGNKERANPEWNVTPANDGSWVGQARSFSLNKYCVQDNNGIWRVNENMATEITQNSGYSYSTVTGYCQSLNYQAINNVKQEAVWQNQQSANNKNSIASIGGGGSPTNPDKTYNEQVLGLKYDEETGSIQNPFQSAPATAAEPVITCPDDGTLPDANGCCTGEIYTDMGEQGFNCCPETGGDCFPPIK